MHTRDACNKLSLPLPLPPPSPPSPPPPAGQWAEGLAAQSAIILRLWSPKPSHAGTQPPGHTKAGAVSSSAAARAQAAHTHTGWSSHRTALLLPAQHFSPQQLRKAPGEGEGTDSPSPGNVFTGMLLSDIISSSPEGVGGNTDCPPAPASCSSH